MKKTFRLFFVFIVLLSFIIYNTVSSIVLFFIPRVLRRKKDIKGQRVLITGAGSGVGRELAIEFSKHATCLILVDIDRQGLLQTEKFLDRCSPVFIYVCDVSDYKKVYGMAEQVQKDAGDVDILVNNAGIVNGKFIWDLSEQQIMKTMEVNALAHFWTCKAFLPAMMEKNRGHIISIISVVGKSGAPQLSDYCASKSAALGFAESIELELRIKKLNGIKVTTVCPSVINTDLFKGAQLSVGSKLSPSYVAEEVVAGVLEDKEMINLPPYFTILFVIKELVPRWFTFRLYEISDAIKLMDKFVGKGHSENEADIEDKTKKTE